MDKREDREFFNKVNCDRCGEKLKGRTMSWFTDETICMQCAGEEHRVKMEMSRQGIDPALYEGCGYIPYDVVPREEDR